MKIFNLKTDDVQTKFQDGVNLIGVDTTWMGTPMRLGDFSMTSCMLFCLKHQLINMYPDRFNNANLFFELNRVGGLQVKDPLVTMSLFPNVWRDITTGADDWYNVRNLISGGNVWSFKAYLEINGIKLPEICEGQHILDPTQYNIPLVDRDKVYLYPVRHKEYNIERNMDDKLLIQIINSIKSPVTLITKDLTDNFNHVKRSCNNVTIMDNMPWSKILLSIIRDSKIFISGDCGLSHLVSMIHEDYKPAMNIYYRTSPFIMDKPLNQFDRYIKQNDIPIDFIPYSPYLTDVMNIKQF